MMVFIYVIPTVLLLLGIRKYIERKWEICTNNVQLDGKVAIVTGANSGIGFEIVKELAARNAQVILACRNVESAQIAISRIKAKMKNVSLIPMELNLACINSIKSFVNEINANHLRINLLFNNAGVSYPISQREVTLDGYEIHFGVNHLGHFHLTNLLLDTLEKSKPSRVIILSSKLHENGEIHLNDLNHIQEHEKSNLYANSKLANVYFCQELAKRTKGLGINVYSVCPGWVYTNLFRNSIKWYHYLLIAPIAFVFMRSPKQGSQTPIYCATEEDLDNETGLMYRNCRQYNSSLKFDPTIASELWRISEEMIAVKEVS